MPPALASPDRRVTFLVRTRCGRTQIARLRTGVDHSGAFPTGSSDAWRSIDVAVLQELILSPLLYIHPDRPATLDRLPFSKDAHEALQAIRGVLNRRRYIRNLVDTVNKELAVSH